MKNEPKIRIKGFEGEWKECLLGDICEINPHSELPDKFEYVDLESVVGTTMVSHRTENIKTAPSRAQRLAQYNDIFFQTVRPYQRNNYLFKKKDGVYVFSTGYAQIRSSMDSGFLFTILQSDSFVNQVILNSTGSSYPAINPTNLAKLSIDIIENKSEQRAIATYFRHIDSLIETADKKVASLKQVKEASLQSMFPKEGQKVPEVRFKGFEGEWKETRLGDIGNTYSGVGFPIEEQGGCTGTPFYKVSDMNNKGNETIMKSSNNYVNENQVEKHGWKICKKIPAIFFAKVGAAVLLDRKRLVLEPCLCDNNTMLYCQNKDSWDPFFCLSLFETIKLSSLSQIGTLPSYNGSAVENLYIKIPSLPEQRKIASFFGHLDKQIAIAQQRLDLLRRIKSACLNEMFV